MTQHDRETRPHAPTTRTVTLRRRRRVLVLIGIVVLAACGTQTDQQFNRNFREDVCPGLDPTSDSYDRYGCADL